MYSKFRIAKGLPADVYLSKLHHDFENRSPKYRLNNDFIKMHNDIIFVVPIPSSRSFFESFILGDINFTILQFLHFLLVTFDCHQELVALLSMFYFK